MNNKWLLISLWCARKCEEGMTGEMLIHQLFAFSPSSFGDEKKPQPALRASISVSTAWRSPHWKPQQWFATQDAFPTPEEVIPAQKVEREQGCEENKAWKGRRSHYQGTVKKEGGKQPKSSGRAWAIKQLWERRRIFHEGFWMLEQPRRGLGMSTLQVFPNIEMRA